MIRREIYLEAAQNRVLERRARELGISEDEFVRRTLHAALGTAGGPPPAETHRAALTRLLTDARNLSERHRLPEHYRFDRAALYDEREEKLLRRR